MTINNLKDLAKLIDLCRKKGIESISIDNMEIKLGENPKKKRISDTGEAMPEPQYSDEDVLNWSTQNYEVG